MFRSIGWGEILVLAVVGLLILGPDRLPKAAADAAKMLRQLRTMARTATADLKAELGPEMADLDLASLHPRRLVTSAIFDDEDALPTGIAASAPLAAGERPPYDADAT